MPTYDYVCDACGHEFEEFQSISADPLVQCPSCGQSSLRRLISGGTGVIFKGSGFYVTDSKQSGNGSGKASGKATDSSETKSQTGESAASGDSGTEGKSEKKDKKEAKGTPDKKTA